MKNYYVFNLQYCSSTLKNSFYREKINRNKQFFFSISDIYYYWVLLYIVHWMSLSMFRMYLDVLFVCSFSSVYWQSVDFYLGFCQMKIYTQTQHIYMCALYTHRDLYQKKIKKKIENKKRGGRLISCFYCRRCTSSLVNYLQLFITNVIPFFLSFTLICFYSSWIRCQWKFSFVFHFKSSTTMIFRLMWVSGLEKFINRHQNRTEKNKQKEFWEKMKWQEWYDYRRNEIFLILKMLWVSYASYVAFDILNFKVSVMRFDDEQLVFLYAFAHVANAGVH